MWDAGQKSWSHRSKKLDEICVRVRGFIGKYWELELLTWEVRVHKQSINIYLLNNSKVTTECPMPSWRDHSESAEDGFFGPEADIWGCGVVFFCILTGSLAKTTKTSKDNTPEEALTHIPIPSSSLRHEDFAVHIFISIFMHIFPVVSNKTVVTWKIINRLKPLQASNSSLPGWRMMRSDLWHATGSGWEAGWGGPPIPSGYQTWQWKIHQFIDVFFPWKTSISNCQVWLPEGNDSRSGMWEIDFAKIFLIFVALCWTEWKIPPKDRPASAGCECSKNSSSQRTWLPWFVALCSLVGALK